MPYNLATIIDEDWHEDCEPVEVYWGFYENMACFN